MNVEFEVERRAIRLYTIKNGTSDGILHLGVLTAFVWRAVRIKPFGVRAIEGRGNLLAYTAIICPFYKPFALGATEVIVPGTGFPTRRPMFLNL